MFFRVFLIECSRVGVLTRRLSECAMRSFLLVCCCSPLSFFVAAVPRFDPTSLLRDVLVPADAAVGSIIYRLRASDPTFDYPLKFNLRGDYTAIGVESLNCTRFNSVCQANVIVRKKLEATRFYDFTVDVRSVNGASTSINCSFRATDATTPWGDIFPGAPTLLMVSEKSRRNTELGSVVARGNPALPEPVYLELWGSPQFALHQRLINLRDAEGTIVLLSQLDYEIKTVHHLTVLSNNPYTEIKTDTRNIAGWPLLVVVLDEQDTPPIFTLAPPTTVLNPSLEPGDLILQVKAEDGDRGKPREIRYSLIPDGSVFSEFFQINEESGELNLVKPLAELISISHSNQPILLTVVAEEVRENSEESPAQSSTVRLALIPPGIRAGSPIFGSTEYNALLDENAPTGTVLKLPQANVQTQPGDVVTLELQNNNGTFDISPSVVEGHADFEIRVHNPKYLDYESRKSVTCDIIAREIGTGNFTAKAKLIVLLNDVNDNPPEFLQEEFVGSIPENAEAGATILRVEATDIDTEPGNKIRYTSLTGPGVNNFNLDPETGVITVANSHSLDAESNPYFELMVEATDENGAGRKSYSKIKIKLLDINDEIPIFEKQVYEFIVNIDKTAFTTAAVIKATDKDITAPNNEIRYEIVNPFNGLVINEVTGELGLTKTWRSTELITLTARAWDGGIPRLSGTCEIRIYPPESNSRKMTFIVPGNDPDVETIANTLRALTGAKVTINDVRPYKGFEPDATDISRDTDTERSVVVATVNYSKGTIIDVKKIQEILDREYREKQHQKAEIREAEGGSLLWLLLLLILLLLLLAFILLCCCLCERCPFYTALNKRRKIRSVEAIKIIASSPGQGHESKSVQVAEWFGRREAWSPEPATLDAESLRRHEMERGSDRSRVQFRTQQQQEYYVREGNADILRLYTSRDPAVQQQRPVTLVAENTYLPDSGKDILMRRFMEQQHSEMSKQQQQHEMLLPNAAVSKLQSEHEALEASLRQQNALLKQILQERERDLKLETQSLPAGTQTDQDAGTQTDPHLFLPPKREVQSNDEQSEGSDEDLAIIKEKVKRRHQKLRRRRIRTPIQEESEMEIVDDSLLDSEVYPVRHPRTQSGIRREVLREISESLRPQREIYNERDIRDEILYNLSNSLNLRDRCRSETRLSRSGIRREILRDLSNSLKNRTASESHLNRDIFNEIRMTQNDPRRSGLRRDVLEEIRTSLQDMKEGEGQEQSGESSELMKEIVDNIQGNKREAKSGTANRARSETRTLKKQEESLLKSESRASTSALKKEILEEIAKSMNQSKKEEDSSMNRARSESRISTSALKREILEEITNSMKQSKKEEESSMNRARSESRISASALKREILEELKKSMNQSKKEKESSKNRARSESRISTSALKREILEEIANSMDQSKKQISDSETQALRKITESLRRSASESRVSKSNLKKKILRELTTRNSEHSLSDEEFTDDSLEETSPNSGEILKLKKASEKTRKIDLKPTMTKPKTQNELSKNADTKLEKKQPRRQSRYMEWYNKNKPKTDTKKIAEKTTKELEKEKIEGKINQRLLKETESSARKKQLKKKPGVGPEHPLLQHSEHRFEAQYVRRGDEDADSGIAMTRPPIAQKKSVFTIAYNDMHTSQIHDTTATTPP